MISSITRTQLHYLDILIQQGSFGRAAEHLSISQPALSMQIQRLEELCGSALVNRSSRPIQATPFGSSFLPMAQSVLRRFGAMEDLIQDAQSTVSGPLRLAVIPTIAPYVLPAVLPHFNQAFPDVKLHVEELPTEALVHALLQEHLDVGLIALPIVQPLTHLKVHTLWDEALWAYHPPEQFSDAIPLETLEAWPTYLLAKGHCLREHVLGLCDPNSLDQDSSLHYESGSLESLMRLVDVQGGITIIPDMARAYLSDDRRLRQTSAVLSPLATRQIVLISKNNSHKKKRIESLKLSLMSYTSKNPPCAKPIPT
ncbi:MAG: hydrogen peroxide-inducible genes activator [Schleiferiaceae bacterium]|nr:hydrogen peroxide-inducible genes activator [Schleiferiaceae bacterium]